jgi:hypothetical protein
MKQRIADWLFIIVSWEKMQSAYNTGSSPVLTTEVVYMKYKHYSLVRLSKDNTKLGNKE